MGCGTGALAFALEKARSPGRLVGADLALGMLRRATLELSQLDLPVAVVQMDAQALGFPDSSFDVVASSFSLDSFPDPGRALSEARRVLRPGGQLGVCIAPSWWWEGDSRWTWHADLLASLGADLGRPTIGRGGPNELRSAMETAGFGDVTLQSETYDLAFSDADEWWGWVWSHGSRRLLESLNPEELDTYRRVSYERIGHDGAHGRIVALIASGVKPSTDSAP
jgi:SAM-dependent methyltransferase